MSDFDNTKFYCGHCPLLPQADGFVSVFGVKQHLLQHHEEPKPVDGEDYYAGWQARKKYHARQKLAQANIHWKPFADPNYSPEDFLIDLGDAEAPEEPACPKD